MLNTCVSKRSFSFSVFLIHSKFRVNKILTTVKEKAGDIRFPEKLKGTVAERWADYWKRLSLDYIEVGHDVIRYSRENPKKFYSIMGSIGLLYACAKTNPDEVSFRESFLQANNEVTMVGKDIRNPSTVAHLDMLEGHYNEGTVKYFSFGLFSILWRDDYNDDLKIFKATCSYLQRFLNFHEKVLDIGFLNNWWMLHRVMNDFDINPNEWPEDAKAG